jgi:UDPglucose 6-dehydrogenase
MKDAESELSDISYCVGPYEVATEADALVILTEWDQFRALDLSRIAGLMRSRVIVDLRNVYKPNEIRQQGFVYVSVGRN